MFDLANLNWMQAAMSGNIRPLVAFLRSESEITQETRRWIADLFEGNFGTLRIVGKLKRKKKRGRPKLTATARWNRKLQKPDLYLAVCDVRRIKRVWRLRYRRSYGVHKKAVELAAKRRGVDAEQVHKQLKMSRKDPRRL